jgi:cytochrome oxidase assembly protein ShyY1
MCNRFLWKKYSVSYVDDIFGLCCELHIPEGSTADAAARLKQGLPIGRWPTVDLRNAHLSYAVTWYAPLD